MHCAHKPDAVVVRVKLKAMSKLQHLTSISIITVLLFVVYFTMLFQQQHIYFQSVCNTSYTAFPVTKTIKH
jgi:hypothetical protein